MADDSSNLDMAIDKIAQQIMNPQKSRPSGWDYLSLLPGRVGDMFAQFSAQRAAQPYQQLRTVAEIAKLRDSQRRNQPFKLPSVPPVPPVPGQTEKTTEMGTPMTEYNISSIAQDRFQPIDSQMRPPGKIGDIVATGEPKENIETGETETPSGRITKEPVPGVEGKPEYTSQFTRGEIAAHPELLPDYVRQSMGITSTKEETPNIKEYNQAKKDPEFAKYMERIKGVKGASALEKLQNRRAQLDPSSPEYKENEAAIAKLTEKPVKSESIEQLTNIKLNHPDPKERQRAANIIADMDKRAAALEKVKAEETGRMLKEDTKRSMAGMLASGELAPSQLPSRGIVAAQAFEVFKLAKEINPNLNIKEMEQDYQRGLSTARYEGGAAVQTPVRLMNSVVANIDVIKGISKEWNRTDFPAINSADFFRRKQTGDKTVVRLDAALTEISDQIAKIFQGGGSGNATSDVKLRQAQELLNKTFSPDQLSAVLDTLKELMENRVKALTTNPATGKSFINTNPPGMPPPLEPKGGEPKIEDLRKKYKY